MTTSFCMPCCMIPVPKQLILYMPCCTFPVLHHLTPCVIMYTSVPQCSFHMPSCTFHCFLILYVVLYIPYSTLAKSLHLVIHYIHTTPFSTLRCTIHFLHHVTLHTCSTFLISNVQILYPVLWLFISVLTHSIYWAVHSLFHTILL